MAYNRASLLTLFSTFFTKEMGLFPIPPIGITDRSTEHFDENAHRKRTFIIHFLVHRLKSIIFAA